MLPKTGNRFPSAGDKKFADAIAGALRDELGDGHRAAKTVMRWTGACERSAKNWLSGSRAPTGWYLILLVRESNNVAKAFLSLAGRGDFAGAADLRAARNALTTALISIDAALNEGSL